MAIAGIGIEGDDPVIAESRIDDEAVVLPRPPAGGDVVGRQNEVGYLTRKQLTTPAGDVG